MTSLVDVALALALEAHAAEVSQAEVGKTAEQVIEDMRSELTPHFQRAWDDPAPKQYHRTGKRMGKSEYIARRLARGALRSPRSTNPYITPTAKQARLLMWPILKRVIERHLPESKVLDHEMTVHVRLNRKAYGTIVVGGCECRADIGRWFGIPFAEAAIDECGTFPPYLGELVADGLEPSTMDFDGHLTLAGNPGVAPIGYWYAATGPARLSKVPLYEGDARDNPHVKAAEFFALKLEENGWTEDHPTFQRMYLGKWAHDPSALCFPWDAHRNAVDALPTHSLLGGVLDPTKWRYTIGVDVAGLGITAIVIVAAHPHDPRTFVVASESHRAWLPEQLVERLRVLKPQYNGAAIVVDTGGLGSVHALHMTRKAHDLYFEPADKRDKKSSIRAVHDEILSGRMCYVAGPATQGVLDEGAVLEWDEKHEQWVDGPADHETDALLYAVRRVRQYSEAAAQPLDNSRAAIAAREAERLKTAALRRARGISPSGRPGWDR